MGLWRVPNSDIQRAFLAKEISHGSVTWQGYSRLFDQGHWLHRLVRCLRVVANNQGSRLAVCEGTKSLTRTRLSAES